MPRQPIEVIQSIDPTTPRTSTRFLDGKRPVVSGFSGNVSNNSVLSLAGHFSNKRNGDWYNGIYTPAQTGTFPIPSYSVTTSDSFLGTGACLVANTVIGQSWTNLANPIITLGNHSECYYSYLRKTVMNVWGDNAEGPQLKLERPVVQSGTHYGGIATIVFWGSTGGNAYSGSGQTQSNWEGNLGSAYGEPSNANLGAHFGNWVRTWGYYKRNDEGKNNGGVFKAFKNESTKTCYFNFVGVGQNGNDTRSSSNVLTPFFNPRYVADTTSEVYNGIGQEFWLPFFKRPSCQLDMFVDGLIINDSPESVWLIDGPNVDVAMATGKAMHIPQLSRNANNITARVWLGDFDNDDSIYVTVFNSNGKNSTPILIRGAL